MGWIRTINLRIHLTNQDQCARNANQERDRRNFTPAISPSSETEGTLISSTICFFSMLSEKSFLMDSMISRKGLAPGISPPILTKASSSSCLASFSGEPLP
ncbi:hypothetical protein Ccrd_025899 [Cynara cardunculus var. scolymus]|uniref:Uncharacterized protein n=1 Tax=Cynara cardunculus var. scolymus TaxID=59895 RepID=A0A118IJ61_CYNCS|nr:hypothetical protein Ccrd_025899 [Cynara cardunculus var. scolymus]